MSNNKEKRRYTKSQLVVETCPICGKVYVPAPEHVYHMPARKTRVCSYHCMLEAERKNEANKKPRGRKRV
jgi:uncharacterized OB-fold protein